MVLYIIWFISDINIISPAVIVQAQYLVLYGSVPEELFYLLFCPQIEHYFCQVMYWDFLLGQERKQMRH